MRTAISAQTYVCLPCLLRSLTHQSLDPPKSKRFFVTVASRRISNSGSISKQRILDELKSKKLCRPDVEHVPLHRRYATAVAADAPKLMLSAEDRSKIGNVLHLHNILKPAFTELSQETDDSSSITVKSLIEKQKENLKSGMFRREEEFYIKRADITFPTWCDQIDNISRFKSSKVSVVTDPAHVQSLIELRILRPDSSKVKEFEEAVVAIQPDLEDKQAKEGVNKSKNEPQVAVTDHGKGDSRKTIRSIRKARILHVKTPKVRQVNASLKIRLLKSTNVGPRVLQRLSKGSTKLRKTVSAESKGEETAKQSVSSLPRRRLLKEESGHSSAPPRAPKDAGSLDVTSMPVRSLEADAPVTVPQLSYGLSRVLFNPGVYQMQDPRSRVFNFDPYLARIMSIREFNFAALPKYVTSSQDMTLSKIALKHNKKYVGSTSSMSGALSHFHFLLSAWRPISFENLSRRIEGLQTFTVITRAPAAIFLRWKDGVYAVDADKEFDSGNVLMMQGKSMEKLLTLSKEEFEKYRKPKEGEDMPKIKQEEDSYHFTGLEDFLIRSQLDAYDPRLPGTGMFDLKTRAVAGVRMNLTDPETGMGYQIKDRYGAWESYEREYLDMIRSAFLKYSLQVRMGRMDGIFVAFHNIARIFGFQYICIDELDSALHGQDDRVLGDQEYKFSIKLMNQLFDLATTEFPEQSIKFVFEMLEPKKDNPQGYMQIFAEAMTSETIEASQAGVKERLADYERRIIDGEPPSTARKQSSSMTLEQALIKNTKSTFESNAPDKAFLDSLLDDFVTEEQAAGKAPAPPKLAAWKLRIFNEVNNSPTIRPENLKTSDKWIVKYALERFTDAEAAKMYTSCKNRRATALGTELDKKYSGNNAFKNAIIQMSEDGRRWREVQDELDAQKEIVVYKD